MMVARKATGGKAPRKPAGLKPGPETSTEKKRKRRTRRGRKAHRTIVKLQRSSDPIVCKAAARRVLTGAIVERAPAIRSVARGACDLVNTIAESIVHEIAQNTSPWLTMVSGKKLRTEALAIAACQFARYCANKSTVRAVVQAFMAANQK